MTEKKQSINQKNQTRDWIPLFFFCVAAGLLATLWGYNYMDGNAEEQLPFIFRAIDPTYLSNDFFTNTFNQYGPRTIFSLFVAFFADFLPLTVVLFTLTTMANIAIAFITAKVAGFFFNNSRFSHYLAAASVLTLKTFWLGYSNIIYRNFLEPEHLAMPLILLGFLFILKKKYISAGFAFGFAAAFHALLGLEIGWILFGLTLVDLIIQRFLKSNQTKGEIKRVLTGILVLTIFSGVLLFPYLLQPSISSSEFINLVAYIRHPHHYLPSTFETWQWGQAAVYLLGSALVFGLSTNLSEQLQKYKRLFVMIAGVTVVLCLGGYLFVEIWPSRIWTSAQMFRIPYFLKWLSLVLISGWAGITFEESFQNKRLMQGLGASLCLVTPASLAFYPLATLMRNKLASSKKYPAWLTADWVIMIATLAVAILYKPELRTWLLFIVFFSLIVGIRLMNWKKSAHLISITILLTLSALFILLSTSNTLPSRIKYEMPVFGLFKTSGELHNVAVYAKENTPQDAIFMIPPNLGEFRYMADRAIVVDFVAYPFQDHAMHEWYSRMAACYGVADKFGFEALQQYNQTVYNYTDEEILALSNRYGFDYAVVYDSTVTYYPIIFRTTTYKLIQITR